MRQWRSKMCAEDVFSKAYLSSDVRGELPIEVFAGTFPRGASSLRWSLKDLCDNILGGDRDGRWVTHHIKFFESALERFGVNGEHLRPSQWSIVARATKYREPKPSVQDLVEFDSEYSACGRNSGDMLSSQFQNKSGRRDGISSGIVLGQLGQDVC